MNLWHLERSALSLVAAVVISLAPLAYADDPASHQGAPSVAPAQSLRLLQEGNQRFVRVKPVAKPLSSKKRADLTRGQSPHSIVLSCSDSRLPPELIFDQGLGKLFVIRVAGNGLEAEGVASIEYALEHLGSKLIVVLGHERCGAVSAALKTPPGTSAGSKSLDVLVASIQGRLGSTLSEEDRKDARLRTAVKVNVDGVAKDLLDRSPMVKAKVDAGEVAVVRAVYVLDSGEVQFWATDGVSALKVKQASEVH